MKNITLAVDDQVLARVRVVAAERKTSVNGLVRDYLTGLADQSARRAETRRQLRELIDNTQARLSPDFVWNREELYGQRVFSRHERADLRGVGKRARKA